jgi:NAD(P)-dependent dehydrogenase (short-subunit alcohol dehydrogenase family)
MFDLNGKVAIVTGASSGLGADAAVALAEAGADVAVLARDMDKLVETKNKVLATGHKCLAVNCDVTSEQEIINAVKQIIKEYNHIDILLNNAGVAVKGGVTTLTQDDWDKSMNTNVKSIYLMAKYIVPLMQAQKYGKIINISSVNAIIADKDDLFIRHSYNASKAAVLGLTKAMAASYAKYNITVNAIGPALFETGMTKDTLFKSPEFLKMYSSLVPANRPAQKGELNGTVIYLASDASRYVNGQFILVDGGLTIV